MTGTGSHADDLRRFGRTVGDAATGTADVVGSLVEAWADATGREWAERLRRVVHELDDVAADAFAVADRADRVDRVDRHAGEPAGVQLGAQTGVRTTGRRGVVVPTLPAPP